MRPVTGSMTFSSIQRVADAHDQRAVVPALGHLEVDDEAAILHGDHLVDFDDAGFGVDFDFRHLYAAHAAVGEIRRLFLSGVLAASGDRRCAELGAGLLSSSATCAGSDLTRILPSFAIQFCPAAALSAGATFANNASRASTAARRVDELTPPGVVMPPEPPEGGYSVSPI